MIERCVAFTQNFTTVYETVLQLLKMQKYFFTKNCSCLHFLSLDLVTAPIMGAYFGISAAIVNYPRTVKIPQHSIIVH